ncbi:MAG: hypothetical protein FWC56_00155 [Phycisphaerae bacterium]|nr:hypothetical protein [Phycisphaerae bacterium]
MGEFVLIGDRGGFRRYRRWRVAMTAFLGIAIVSGLCSGCDDRSDRSNLTASQGEPTVSYDVEQQIPLQEVIQEVSRVEIETQQGGITVRGVDQEPITATAQIRVWAYSEKDAQRLAEQVKLHVKRTGDTLRIHPTIPPGRTGCRFEVTVDVPIPRQLLSGAAAQNSDRSLKVQSETGSVKVDNIEGTVIAKTSTGSIELNEVSGPVRLETCTGSITVRNAMGGVTAKTTTGSITINSAKSHVTAETSTGTAVVEVNADQWDGNIVSASSCTGTGRVVIGSLTRKP